MDKEFLVNNFSNDQLIETLKILIKNTDQTELNFTGGTHIIFEDGNYRKKDVEFCKKNSIKIGNLNCYLICCLLETFKTEEDIKNFIENDNTYV